MADEGFNFLKPQVDIQPVEAPDMMTPYLQAVDSINQFTGEVHGIAQKIDESALQAERLTLQGIGRDTYTKLTQDTLDPKNFGVNSLQQFQVKAQAANAAILQNVSSYNRPWAKAMLAEYQDGHQTVVATHVNELTKNNMLMAGLEGMEGQFDDADKAAFNGDMDIAKIAHSQGKNTIQNLVANGLLHPISAVNRERDADFSFETSAYSGQIARHFESLTNIQQKDYSSLYNTKLTPDQEQQFENWAAKQQPTTGRDVTKDLYNYDLKGWWLENKGASLTGGHLTDKFKKPNHPTFSNESIYEGTPSLEGGKNTGGTWDGEKFIPAPKQDWISNFEKNRGNMEPRVYQAVKTDYVRQHEEWMQQNNINASTLHEENNNIINLIAEGKEKVDGQRAQNQLNTLATAAPEQVEPTRSDFDFARQYHDHMQMLYNVPFANRETALNQIKIDPNDRHYAEAEKWLALTSKGTGEQAKAFLNDPVSYVGGTKAVQDIAQQAQVNPNNPATQSEVDAAIVNSQRYLGVGMDIGENKVWDESRISLLSNEQSSDFVRSIDGKQLSDQFKQVVDLASQHQGYEGILMNDLNKQGIHWAMPNLLQMYNSDVSRPYTETAIHSQTYKTEKEQKEFHAAFETAANGKIKFDDLYKMIGNNLQSNNYTDVYSSMSGNPTDNIARIQQFVTDLAAQGVLEKKFTPSNCVDKATKLAFPETKVHSMNGFSFMSPDSLNDKTFVQGLDYLKGQAETANLDIQPHIKGFFQSPTTVKQNIKDLVSSATLVNNASFDGVKLVDAAGVTLTMKGKPFELKFKDLESPTSKVSLGISKYITDKKAQKYQLIKGEPLTAPIMAEDEYK